MDANVLDPFFKERQKPTIWETRQEFLVLHLLDTCLELESGSEASDEVETQGQFQFGYGKVVKDRLTQTKRFDITYHNLGYVGNFSMYSPLHIFDVFIS